MSKQTAAQKAKAKLAAAQTTDKVEEPKLSKKAAKAQAKAAKAAKEYSKNSKEEQEADTPKETEVALQKPSKSLSAIAKAIVSKFTAEAKTSIEIGGLLKDAQFYFIPKGGKNVKMKDWLVWSEDNFGIKKAQAYNLMSINRVFADMPSFGDVQTQVLVQLTRDEAMMRDAMEALEDGEEVDAKWLKSYRKEKLEAQALLSGASKEDDEEQEEGEEGAMSASAKQREKDEQFVKQLEDRIEELEAKLENAGSNYGTQYGKPIVAFMSKLQPYQILAIAEGSNKRKANEAKRKLVKAYADMTSVIEVIEAAATTF